MAALAVNGNVNVKYRHSVLYSRLEAVDCKRSAQTPIKEMEMTTVLIYVQHVNTQTRSTGGVNQNRQQTSLLTVSSRMTRARARETARAGTRARTTAAANEWAGGGEGYEYGYG